MACLSGDGLPEPAAARPFSSVAFWPDSLLIVHQILAECNRTFNVSKQYQEICVGYAGKGRAEW